MVLELGGSGNCTRLYVIKTKAEGGRFCAQICRVRRCCAQRLLQGPCPGLRGRQGHRSSSDCASSSCTRVSARHRGGQSAAQRREAKAPKSAPSAVATRGGPRTRTTHATHATHVMHGAVAAAAVAAVVVAVAVGGLTRVWRRIAVRQSMHAVKIPAKMAGRIARANSSVRTRPATHVRSL